MAQEFLPGDPFHELEGKDGFHVVKVEIGEIITLSCVAYYKGEQISVVSGDHPQGKSLVELCSLKSTPVVRGTVERLHLALDGVCRYLTTGGNWNELELALELMKQVAVDGLKFPGYYLH